MAAPGRACNGNYLKEVKTSAHTQYCTHEKAKGYTCPYLCAHGMCPMEGAPKEGK